jgi:dienelactone hydrolase/Tol biopolymer transport system component
MKSIGLFIITCVFVLHTKAQSLTKQDYARAVSFLWQNINNKKAYNLSLHVNWFADSSGFWYLTQSKEGKTYHKWLKADHSLHPIVSSDTLPVKPAGQENPMEEKSPDGKWVAYSDRYNLYLKSTTTGAVRQLSTAGIKEYEYASYYGWGDIMAGENGTRPPHFGVSWSPDSKWIQTYICDLRRAKKMYLLDWSVDTLYRARLLSYYRGSPGDTDMVYMTPVFFNVETGEEIRRDEFRNVNAVSCEWSKQGAISYIEDLVRGYQHVNLYRYDLGRRNPDKIYSESSLTNIDGYRSELVEELGKILLISEKDGWRQLYLLNINDHAVKPLTNGEWYVNDVLFIDRKKGRVIFTASGKEPGRNPYFHHAYTINPDGSGLKLLTPENANHSISVSPDGEYFVDNISALDKPTRSVLREGKTGKIIAELSKADIDGLMEMGYRFPEPFVAVGRDGTTPIYGAIWKPSHFDSLKKYPIIDQTYTGPHTHQFPEDFVSSLNRSNQALAELGFIVVTIDGMGTAGRSKAFHNVSYKNMGRNLLDHVLAIRELGQGYSWIDTTRVGIFGHSAGGYDAGHAVLEFPDFYKVAVASSGDHDFRMEKDWWPEMYMGWPVDSTYNEVSNITMAGNLKGKLLLVHGGIDENVNPSATFKLAEALVKADKEFDMLIFPSQHHGYQGKFSDYFLKKKWNYFVENLLGEKPIWDFDLQ